MEVGNVMAVMATVEVMPRVRLTGTVHRLGSLSHQFAHRIIAISPTSHISPIAAPHPLSLLVPTRLPGVEYWLLSMVESGITSTA
jgi:hypothetical protein